MTKSDALRPRRQLGLFDATMIVMGGIVGAGIFANPSEVAHRVHTPLLILGVWVVGGAFAMCGAFIWAELATRLPDAEGGQYVYLREAYHPAVAFVYGWGLLLVTQTGGMAAVAVIFASYFRALTGVDWNDSAIAATVLLVLTGVNCFGARRQQCAERFHVVANRSDRGACDTWIFAWRQLSQVRAIASPSVFSWSFGKHWIRDGSHCVCLWRLADLDFCSR